MPSDAGAARMTQPVLLLALLLGADAAGQHCRSGSTHRDCDPQPPPPPPPSPVPAVSPHRRGSGDRGERERTAGGRVPSGAPGTGHDGLLERVALEGGRRGSAEAPARPMPSSHAAPSPRTREPGNPGERPGDARLGGRGGNTPVSSSSGSRWGRDIHPSEEVAAAHAGHLCSARHGHDCLPHPPPSPPGLPFPSPPPPPQPPGSPPRPPAPPVPPSPPSPPPSAPPPPSPRYDLQFEGEGCGTVMALQYAASLRHCARLVGSGFFSYNAATHYCFNCSPAQVRRRIPHSGYSVFNTSHRPPPPSQPPTPPPPPPPPFRANFGKCATPQSGDVRLNVSASPATAGGGGRVLLTVYEDGHWGCVCVPFHAVVGVVGMAGGMLADVQLSAKAAVACRQLGHVDGVLRVLAAEEPVGIILAHEMECNGKCPPPLIIILFNVPRLAAQRRMGTPLYFMFIYLLFVSSRTRWSVTVSV
ncbi:hypothetical protein T492DRAFT_1004953, partial [Pavlovales sp. CCMP2436]